VAGCLQWAREGWLVAFEAVEEDYLPAGGRLALRAGAVLGRAAVVAYKEARKRAVAAVFFG